MKYATPHNTFLDHYSATDRLRFILQNPDIANKMTEEHHTKTRPVPLTEALKEALDFLPKGKSKRVLDYICRNPGAEFYFTKTDAVGPAIREALVAMGEAA